MVGGLNVSVASFQRRLSGEALEYLRGMPRWWGDVLAHHFEDRRGVAQPLLIALRDGYLNVYAEGQSVLRVGFDARRASHAGLRCRIHRKYVRGPEAGKGYYFFDGAQVTDGERGSVIEIYDGPDTLGKWVASARHYASGEKVGVAVIANNHPEVIDVEMGLPANAPLANEEREGSRMDIVALEEHEGLRLAFYEAKLFSNQELRARNLRPRVLGQLGRYRDYVSAPDRRAEVIAAYENACSALVEIAAMRGTEPNPLVRAVADGVQLTLDPEPRLVVFGYDAKEVASGSPWQPHADALRANGVALLLGAKPEDIVLRTPEPAATSALGGY